MTLASAKARTGMQNAPERAAVPELEKGVENPFFI